MVLCNICCVETRASKLQCSTSTCGKVYHYSCLGIERSNFEKMNKQRKRVWKCPKCKKKKNSSEFIHKTSLECMHDIKQEVPSDGEYGEIASVPSVESCGVSDSSNSNQNLPTTDGHSGVAILKQLLKAENTKECFYSMSSNETSSSGHLTAGTVEDHPNDMTDDSNCISNLLECHLEEEAPSADWAIKFQNTPYDIPVGSGVVENQLRSKTWSMVHIIEDDPVTKATPKQLISIKVSPLFVCQKGSSFLSLTHKEIDRMGRVENLMSKLKQSQYLEQPVRWLVEKSLASSSCQCDPNAGSKHAENVRMSDTDICWQCRKCKEACITKLPKFFMKSIPLQDMFALLFHWAAQSKFENVVADVKLSFDRIWQVWKSMQQLCSSILSVSTVALGSKPRDSVCRIEVAIFRYGPFYILGAMERDTRYTRLQVLKETMHSDLVTLLTYMVQPRCCIISDCSLFEDIKLHDYNFAYADPKITDETHDGWHNLNVKKYMRKQLYSMFHKFSADSFDLEALQLFLDELQWRERYGHHVERAFWNFVYFVAGQQNSSRFDPLPYRPHFEIYADEEITDQILLELDEIEEKIEYVIDPRGLVSSAPTEDNEKNLSGLMNQILACDIPPDLVNAELNDKLILKNSMVNIVEGQKALVSSLLSVKTWPLQLSLISDNAPPTLSVQEFREKLKSENFFTQPESWLVYHNLLQQPSPCSQCSGTSFSLICDKIATYSKIKMYVWVCNEQMCQNMTLFHRSGFLRWFTFSIADLLKLFYHWSVQTEQKEMKTDVSLNEHEIRYVYFRIQRLCSMMLHQRVESIGTPDQVVEVAVVQYGQFYIIGALDRATKLSRLKVMAAYVAMKPHIIHREIIPWLVPYSLVATSFGNFFFHGNMLRPLRENSREGCPEMNNASVTLYLSQLVAQLFGKYSLAGVKLNILQEFLDEVQWRDRWGSEPELAFWSILNHMTKERSSAEQASKNKALPLHPRIVHVTSVNEEWQAQPSPTSSECHSEAMSTTLNVPRDTTANTEKKLASPVTEGVPVVNANPDLPTNSNDNQLVHVPADISAMNYETSDSPNEPYDTSGHPYLSNTMLIPSSDYSSLEEQNTYASISVNPYIANLRVPITSNTTIDQQEESDASAVIVSKRHICKKEEEHCLTVEKANVKMLRPLLMCLNIPFESSKRKANSEIEFCKNTCVSVDEYYFARSKQPKLIPVEQKLYAYKCSLCKQYIYGNIDAMDHTIMHVAMVRSAKHPKLPPQCSLCFRHFLSIPSLEIHDFEVHKQKNSLACLICSMLFGSTLLFTEHMKVNHVQSDMPYACAACHYRSSVHKEVLLHFREFHKYEPHLVCPYCLKMCSPSGDIDEILITHKYCQHLLKHQEIALNYQCPACQLFFLDAKDVQVHVLKDHMSFADREGVYPFEPRVDPIVVTSPKADNMRIIPFPLFYRHHSVQLAMNSAYRNVTNFKDNPSPPLKQIEQSLNQSDTDSPLPATVHHPNAVPSSSGLPNLKTVLTEDTPFTAETVETTLPKDVHEWQHVPFGSIVVSKCVSNVCSLQTDSVMVSDTQAVAVGAKSAFRQESQQPVEKSLVDINTPETISQSSLEPSLDSPVMPNEKVHRTDSSVSCIVSKLVDIKPFNVSELKYSCENCTCFECGSVISHRHFLNKLSCHCKYSTHCVQAFVNHLAKLHHITSHPTQLPSLQSGYLRKSDVECSCGFSHRDGDVMASHYLKCCGSLTDVQPQDWRLDDPPDITTDFDVGMDSETVDLESFTSEPFVAYANSTIIDDPTYVPVVSNLESSTTCSESSIFEDMSSSPQLSLPITEEASSNSMSCYTNKSPILMSECQNESKLSGDNEGVDMVHEKDNCGNLQSTYTHLKRNFVTKADEANSVMNNFSSKQDYNASSQKNFCDIVELEVVDNEKDMDKTSTLSGYSYELFSASNDSKNSKESVS